MHIATQAGFLSSCNITCWGNSTDGVEAPFGKDTVFADRRSMFYYLTDDIVDFVSFSASVGGQGNVVFQVPRSLFIDAARLTLGGSAIIGPMGAREAIRDLEEDPSELHSSEMPDEAAIKNEIIALGVNYQIKSSETSFIAIDNLDWTSRNGVDPADGGVGGGPVPAPTATPGGGVFLCYSGWLTPFRLRTAWSAGGTVSSARRKRTRRKAFRPGSMILSLSLSGSWSNMLSSWLCFPYLL